MANIHSGLVALVGIGPDDGDADVEWAVRKLLNTRLFDDRQSTKPWTASVTNAGADRGDGEAAAPGDVLLISQFIFVSQCTHDTQREQAVILAGDGAGA